MGDELRVLPLRVGCKPHPLNRIAHFGVGNFHRAHQAAYVDDLHDDEWSICGLGVMPQDAAMRDALARRDFAYDLIEGGRQRTIRSIREFVLEPEAIVATLADPHTRIVTLTITEAGYVPGSPVFALLGNALRQRDEPFTVLSCDNLEGNGDLTAALLGHPDGVDFPNCMVDRITPATPSPSAPVVCEAFRQWVIEDRFRAGRPRLEDVGVTFVDNVRPYELMKIRLLNGGHQVVAYFGERYGHAYIHDAVRDERVLDALHAYWRDEAIPTLAPIPGVDYDAYTATLLERFVNDTIADTVARIRGTVGAIDAFLGPVINANPSAVVAREVAGY